jgi:hypothetical protein
MYKQAEARGPQRGLEPLSAVAKRLGIFRLLY